MKMQSRIYYIELRSDVSFHGLLASNVVFPAIIHHRHHERDERATGGARVGGGQREGVSGAADSRDESAD